MTCFGIFHSKPRSSQHVSKDKTPPTNSNSQTRRVETYGEKENKLKKFSFSELRDATTNFNKLLKIGEGGFGCVYKARLRLSETQTDPLVVAIKKLNKQSMQVASTFLELCFVTSTCYFFFNYFGSFACFKESTKLCIYKIQCYTLVV